jgi:hypothetical protein
LSEGDDAAKRRRDSHMHRMCIRRELESQEGERDVQCPVHGLWLGGALRRRRAEVFGGILSRGKSREGKTRQSCLALLAPSVPIHRPLHFRSLAQSLLTMLTRPRCSRACPLRNSSRAHTHPCRTPNTRPVPNVCLRVYGAGFNGSKGGSSTRTDLCICALVRAAASRNSWWPINAYGQAYAFTRLRCKLKPSVFEG